MYIRSKRIYLYDECVKGILNISEGKIADILPYDADVTVDLDVGDNRVIPGIFDTHNHGTSGYGPGLVKGDKEAARRELQGYLKGLASQGVTGIFPTTVDLNGFDVIADMADEEVDGAKILGIHSEGPYLNRVGEKGVDNGHPDISLEAIADMVKRGRGKLKLVAIAAELPLAEEAIKYLTSQGVTVSLAHTNCDSKQAREAFKWGITVTTHTANVMTGIHHRNMGTLGAALLEDDIYNEIICDGKHVSNEMLEIMFRIKRDPYNRFMMVSDCSNLSGAPVGRYCMMEGMPEVNVTEDGFCLTDTGRLIGSTMPVLKGIKNLVENVGIAMKYAIRMASLNPSKFYGYDHKGKIEVGYDADMTIIDDDHDCLYTLVEGRIVYDRSVDKDIFSKTFLEKNKR